MSNVEMLLRLVTAAALGSLIGFERERLLWAAGIRTHMLVCVGSCLIMIVSQYGFSNILTEKNVVLDPSRIAAQVVSGIGFLGAGAILARGEIVKGLTTAASIWTVAAVGLAVGGGLYLAASTSTVIILIILAGIKPLEEAYRSRNQSCQLKIEVDNGSLTPELLKETLGLRTGQIKRFLVENRNQQRDRRASDPPEQGLVAGHRDLSGETERARRRPHGQHRQEPKQPRTSADPLLTFYPAARRGDKSEHSPARCGRRGSKVTALPFSVADHALVYPDPGDFRRESKLSPPIRWCGTAAPSISGA